MNEKVVPLPRVLSTRIADEISEHLEQPFPITPDLGNLTIHVDSKLERRRRCEGSLHFHRVDEQLTCREARSFDGQLTGLHECDIQEILNQPVQAYNRATDTEWASRRGRG